MNKCMVTSCDNNTGFGDCMYPNIKECNTRDQSSIQKAYKQGRADAIEEFKDLGKLYSEIRTDAIEEIDKILLNRFDCNDLRTDWTNADIRETIHFELEQLKEKECE